jgi:hypothetical protein
MLRIRTWSPAEIMLPREITESDQAAEIMAALQVRFSHLSFYVDAVHGEAVGAEWLLRIIHWPGHAKHQKLVLVMPRKWHNPLRWAHPAMRYKAKVIRKK